MRKRITIQRISTRPTAGGETTDTPTLVCQAWASIEPLGGRESWLAKAQQDTSSHRIRMRYRQGITPLMRAVYQGRVFHFTSVNDLEELHRELEILATEVVG